MTTSRRTPSPGRRDMGAAPGETSSVSHSPRLFKCLSSPLDKSCRLQTQIVTGEAGGLLCYYCPCPGQGTPAAVCLSLPCRPQTLDLHSLMWPGSW